MTVDASKQPLQQFCAGLIGNRYPGFQGESLTNATVVQQQSQTGRSPTALVPRSGTKTIISDIDVLTAHHSYSLDTDIIIAQSGQNIIVYTTSLPFTETTVLITIPNITIVDKPLIVDTYEGVVFSINETGYSISESFVVTKITGAGWAYPSSLSFIDGYVLVSVKGTRQFVRSELNGTTFTDTVNFSATQSSDNIANISTINREVYIFGTQHTEVWWNSGASAVQPFTRQDGRVYAYGIKSINTLVLDGVGYNCCFSNNMFGIFSWNNTPTKISTDGIDQYLEKADKIYLSTSVEDGRRYIHVIADDNHIVYDLLSTSWHIRTNIDPIDYFFSSNEYFVATKDNKIKQITGSTDDAVLITCTRISPHVLMNNLNLIHNMLELDTAGNINEMHLYYSDDGGNTWLNVNYSSIGQYGIFNRYIYRRLGISRDRVYKLMWTTSPIYSALLVVEQCAR